MTPFMYFVIAVYCFSSLLAYSIKSYEIFWEHNWTWTRFKDNIGDICIKFFFIYVIWWSSGNLVSFW